MANSTVSAEQAREAVEFFAPKGVIYTAARAGQVCAHRMTLESFIAQHSTEPVAAGWRLLEVGEVICEGDEVFDTERQEWMPAEHFDAIGDKVTDHDNPIRRRFAAQGQTGETK